MEAPPESNSTENVLDDIMSNGQYDDYDSEDDKKEKAGGTRDENTVLKEEGEQEEASGVKDDNTDDAKADLELSTGAPAAPCTSADGVSGQAAAGASLPTTPAAASQPAAPAKPAGKTRIVRRIIKKVSKTGEVISQTVVTDRVPIDAKIVSRTVRRVSSGSIAATATSTTSAVAKGSEEASVPAAAPAQVMPPAPVACSQAPLVPQAINPSRPARYFIIKSLYQHHLEISVQKGVWSTQPHNEEKLNEAFVDSDVYLIFSVNNSRHFQGYARMTSRIEPARGYNPWSEGGSSPWAGIFSVEWIRMYDLPFADTLHVRNPLNEGKPVKISRDGQELTPEAGQALCAMIDEGASTLKEDKIATILAAEPLAPLPAPPGSAKRKNTDGGDGMRGKDKRSRNQFGKGAPPNNFAMPAPQGFPPILPPMFPAHFPPMLPGHGMPLPGAPPFTFDDRQPGRGGHSPVMPSEGHMSPSKSRRDMKSRDKDRDRERDRDRSHRDKSRDGSRGRHRSRHEDEKDDAANDPRVAYMLTMSYNDYLQMHQMSEWQRYGGGVPGGGPRMPPPPVPMPGPPHFNPVFRRH